jgi:hypothetical protein
VFNFPQNGVKKTRLEKVRMACGDWGVPPSESLRLEKVGMALMWRTNERVLAMTQSSRKWASREQAAKQSN